MQQVPTSPQASTKRRITPQAREQFRQELIDIARQIFLNEGYAAVTIRRITAEAGVTPMAFYWYFDCKEALLTVIWDGLLQQARDDYRQRVQDVPPDARLMAYFEAMVDYWLRHRAYFRFIFLGDTHQGELVRLRAQLMSRPGMQRVYLEIDEMVRASLSSQTDQAARTLRIRTLALYRVFGFLSATIGLHDLGEVDTARHRQWVLDDLRIALQAWCAEP